MQYVSLSVCVCLLADFFYEFLCFSCNTIGYPTNMLGCTQTVVGNNDDDDKITTTTTTTRGLTKFLTNDKKVLSIHNRILEKNVCLDDRERERERKHSNYR